MSDLSGVYILEFETSIYVGSSKHIRRRVKRHIADLAGGRHSNPKMRRAFEKHGAPNYRILVECPEGDLLQQEQMAINELRPPLNCSPTAGRNVGHRHNAETISRMRSAGKAAWEKRSRHVPQVQRDKIASALRGREFSAETRAKISAAKKGSVHTPEARERMKLARKGIVNGPRERCPTTGRYLGSTPILAYEGRPK